MSHSALGIAEMLQGASIKRHPSPRHDINPSTAASEKVLYEQVADPDHEPSEVDTASIATDIIDRPALRPIPRRRDLPPLPDLRFEQSYLASIRDAETWQRVAWITIRDQILLPLIQGTVWTLALSGWRFWNRNAQLQGNTLGTRLRRWWYTVNKWPVPPAPAPGESKEQIVERAQEFYTAQFTSD